MDIASLLNPLPPAHASESLSPSSSDPPRTPTKPIRYCLSRDDRVLILGLRRAGLKPPQIAVQIGCTVRAVQYTLQKKKATPRHDKAGRPPKLQNDEVDRIIAFIKECRKHRRMKAEEIALHFWPEGNVSPETLSIALKRRGMNRRNCAPEA